MYKKLLLSIIVMVIALLLVGCEITIEQAQIVASSAGFLVSEDGTDYFSSLYYAGRWWYMHYNTASEMLKYGSSNFGEINNIKNTLVVAGYKITSWAMLPEVVKDIMLYNLLEALPLYPLWQAPILVFPMMPDGPQLFVLEVPM